MGKGNAIITAIIVLALLAVVLLIKLRNDRKRKSNIDASFHRETDYIKANQGQQNKNSNLFGIPAWVLALLTMFLAFGVLMIVGEIVLAVFKISESDAGDLVFYLLYNLIIAGGCFIICKHNPRSIWYVPVICNIAGILSAIIEPNFWTGALWMVICGGWVLSVIASIAGVKSGSKKTSLT